MTTLQGSLLLIGAAIIIGLAVYAAMLWRQVFSQRQQQQAAISTRTAKLREQIQHIVKATIAEQCQPAESALRLVNLLRAIPTVNNETLEQQLPHLHALYFAIADQPILDERKALPKLKRRLLDAELEQAQALHGPAMLTELEQRLANENQFDQLLTEH